MTRWLTPGSSGTFLLGLLSYMALPLCPPASRLAVGAPADREIRQLITNLGSNRFADREAATRKLMEMDEAESALREARNAADPEVRRRVADILRGQQSQRALRGLTKAKALGKNGRAVEMVDRLVCWANWDTKSEGWSAVTRFTEKLIDLTARDFAPPTSNSFRRLKKFPAGDFRRYIDIVHPQEVAGRDVVIRSTGTFLLRGENITIEKKSERILLSIAAASKNVRASEEVLAPKKVHIPAVFFSVIIAGESIKVGRISLSMLICDGDVELSSYPDCSLIIARGKVTCRSGSINGCMVRSEHSLLYPNDKKIAIKEGTPDPLGFVKFFEFADVGLTVSDRDQKDKPVPDGVRLKDVLKDSPFVSGLRRGDVVTALDGIKAVSPEIFRRLLRRSLAKGGPVLTFTVRRSDKTLDVPIFIKD